MSRNTASPGFRPAHSTWLLVPLLLAACGGGGEKGGGPRGPGDRAVPVTTADADRGSIAARATYVAELLPQADVQLAAEVPGRVASVAVDLGDTVEAGQVLATLDDAAYRQALREARAAFAVAQAQQTQAQVEAETAGRDFERKKPLVDKGLLSRGEWDTVEARQRTATSSQGLADATLAQARARLARARLDADRTRIVAPFAGRVAAREVDPGALVSVGSPLFRLTAVDPLVVRFAAPEADVTRIEAGQVVSVGIDAVPGERFEGEVARISPVVDPQTRTTPVEVVLPNPGPLKPGMFARVEVTLADKAEALVVPASAVVRRQVAGGGEVEEGVFVLADATARFTPVRLGVRSRERVEVVEGLTEGQTVVTAGHADLKDGAQVRVVEAVVGAREASDEARGS